MHNRPVPSPFPSPATFALCLAVLGWCPAVPASSHGPFDFGAGEWYVISEGMVNEEFYFTGDDFVWDQFAELWLGTGPNTCPDDLCADGTFGIVNVDGASEAAYQLTQRGETGGPWGATTWLANLLVEGEADVFGPDVFASSQSEIGAALRFSVTEAVDILIAGSCTTSAGGTLSGSGCSLTVTGQGPDPLILHTMSECTAAGGCGTVPFEVLYSAAAGEQVTVNALVNSLAVAQSPGSASALLEFSIGPAALIPLPASVLLLGPAVLGTMLLGARRP